MSVDCLGLHRFEGSGTHVKREAVGADAATGELLKNLGRKMESCGGSRQGSCERSVNRLVSVEISLFDLAVSCKAEEAADLPG